MKQSLMICSLCLFTALSLGAQGRGRGSGGAAPPMRSNSPNTSNAPAGTPHASPDRDFGRDRAADVGRGKQTGLDKDTSVNQKSHKHKHKDKSKNKNKKGEHTQSKEL